MKHFNDMLELRLEHAATPERVAVATRMLADLLQRVLPQLGDDDPEAAQPTVTIVVSNYSTKATVRVWDDALETPVDAVREFIHNPGTADYELAELIGPLLMRYARREFKYQPTFWDGAHQLRAVDESFIAEIRQALAQQRTRAPRATAATFVTTRIYRVGRRRDGDEIKARLLLPDEQFHEVPVDPHLVHDFVRALDEGRAKGREFRVKLMGAWRRRDGKLEFLYDAPLRAIGIDDRVGGSAQAFLAAVAGDPVIKRGELAKALRKLDEDDDDE